MAQNYLVLRFNQMIWVVACRGHHKTVLHKASMIQGRSLLLPRLQLSSYVELGRWECCRSWIVREHGFESNAWLQWPVVTIKSIHNYKKSKNIFYNSMFVKIIACTGWKQINLLPLITICCVEPVKFFELLHGSQDPKSLFTLFQLAP